MESVKKWTIKVSSHSLTFISLTANVITKSHLYEDRELL